MRMTTSSRRAFLRTFAGASFASVMLRHFVSTAATGSFPIRFVFVFTHDGRHQTSQHSGTGANFKLGASFEPLEQHRDKLLILDGMKIPDHVNEEHPNGRCAMLTGRPSSEKWTGTGVSIDRFLATALTNGKSVYTGSAAPGGSATLDPEISWHAANIANRSHYTGDKELFKGLFSGVAPASTQAAVPDASAVDATRDNELALNGFLSEEVRRLEKVAPAEEREKMRLHLEALAQLRESIDGAQNPGGGPVLVPPTSCTDPLSVSAVEQVDRSNQIIARALACGQARIVVNNLDAYDPHHEYSHDPDPTSLVALDAVYTKQFANFLGYLQSYPEGDGTLLDNTIVVLSSEVCGSYSGGDDIHGTVNMPLIIAGGKNAGLKNGERIVTGGFWNTELYRGIAQAMGVTDTSGFGDPARPTPLADIFAA